MMDLNVYENYWFLPRPGETGGPPAADKTMTRSCVSPVVHQWAAVVAGGGAGMRLLRRRRRR